MEKIQVKSQTFKHFPRFGVTGKTINFKINPIPNDEENPTAWVQKALWEAVQVGTTHLDPDDLVGFTFSSKDFTRGQGWIPFQPAEKVDCDKIFEMVSNIYQSNSCGLDTNTFELGVTSIRKPKGSGRGRKASHHYNSFNEECRMRRGIIVIDNNDNLCLPRALVVAIAKATKNLNFKKLCRNKNLQKQKAIKLCEDAKIIIPAEGCGLEEVQLFQNYLKGFKISIYEYSSKQLLFEGHCQGENVKKINLIYFQNHFNVIISLTAAFACSYYCEDCHVRYNNKNRHMCKKSCPYCKQIGYCQREIKKHCADCNKIFFSDKCFENHLTSEFTQGKTVCEIFKTCIECNTGYRADNEHKCGERFCKTCKQLRPSEHFCFMQIDKTIPQFTETLYVFFDLETRQENLLEDGSYLHEANLCVVKTCCDLCIENTEKFCHKCGPNLLVLRSDPVKNLIALILTKRKLFKKVIVLSHYGGGFDMQFILNELLKETDHTPEVILNGTKILLMTVGNVKFLDSINFMAMKLSALPKAFGLPADKFKKGYFPHLFNKLENESYVGPLPPIEYYDPDSMYEKDRMTFLKWYEENRHCEFNFKQDLISYCISDVEILMEASLKFRQLMLETSSVCPFAESCTIPGACNVVFRRNFHRFCNP